jgi:hypothetical protein
MAETIYAGHRTVFSTHAATINGDAVEEGDIALQKSIQEYQNGDGAG